MIASAAYNFAFSLLLIKSIYLFAFDPEPFGAAWFHNLFVFGLRLCLVFTTIAELEEAQGIEFLENMLERLYWEGPKFINRALKRVPVIKVL